MHIKPRLVSLDIQLPLKLWQKDILFEYGLLKIKIFCFKISWPGMFLIVMSDLFHAIIADEKFFLKKYVNNYHANKFYVIRLWFLLYFIKSTIGDLNVYSIMK